MINLTMLVMYRLATTEEFVMPTHRFRNQLRQSQFQPVLAGSVDAAFVPCPMYASMTASQQDLVQDIYRRAAEMTQEQFRLQRAWQQATQPAFSLN